MCFEHDNLNFYICLEAKNHQKYRFLHKLDTKCCVIFMSDHILLKLSHVIDSDYMYDLDLKTTIQTFMYKMEEY